MNVCVFLDLDDTLFQTLPKCPPDDARRPAAYRRDGAALSFITCKQDKLLELLNGMATVIPVTARNLDAFRRVDLPFRSLAILDFGGVVLLPDGTLDADWDAQVRPQALAAKTALHALRASCQNYSDRHKLGARARVIDDFDMPLYVVIKHPDGNAAALDDLRIEHLTCFDLQPFLVHANGNNLSIVPRFLGKERAVRHVLDKHLNGPSLTVGIGDSFSDLPFLKLCDFMMTPTGSQLASLFDATNE